MTASTTIPSGDVSGLGTIATQNANAVAITGGTVNGTTIGATTASTGAFTYLSTSGSTSTTPTLSFNGSNTPIAAGATISGSYLQFILQNKSGTAGASTNYVLSNDLGTDSSYYGEFGMNSSVYSASTPADFFSLNNGIYFSGHDGDLTIGSGNGYKTYLAWGTTGQSAHVINASGAIGLNTNITGSTNFGTSGQVLTSAGNSATPTWATPTTGTVTSVALALPSIFSVTGSPVTTSGTLTGALTTQTAATVFAGPATGAAATPTFRAIVATDIPTLNQNTTGSAATLTTPRNIYGNAFDGSAALTQVIASTYGGTGNGFTKFSGATTAEKTYTLPDANATLLYAGGALGTPSSGTVTNLTGTASININGTVGATTANTGAFTTLSATGVITSTLATGTAPFTVASTTQVANLNAATAGTATTATNLASGALGSVPYQNSAGATLFLAGTTSTTPSFVTSTGTGTLTQAPTLTSSTGSGNVVLATSPTLVTPALGTPSALVGTNITGTATSFNINGTVGATTAAAGTFTQVTVNGANLNTAISPTGTGTVTIAPAGATTLGTAGVATTMNGNISATTSNQTITLSPTGTGTVAISPVGALTINPTAASTINNASIGVTTPLAGSFTSLTATSVGTAGVLAKTGGKTAVTAIAATTTLTTGGTTLASQVMASGSVWRVTAYGTFAAVSSATTRTFTMACFWGATQLTAITTGSVLTGAAQTTPWKVEFEITGSSATAAWVTGFLSAQVTSATIPLNYAATAASTTGLTTTSTLDIRFANGTSALDAINVQQVIIERIV
jgi:hypothetical protein